MRKNVILLVLVGMILMGCSGLGVAKAVVGASDIIPDVAQVGKTNTIGVTDVTEVSIREVTGDVRPVVRPEGITTTSPTDTIKQYNYNYSPWMIFAAIIWSIFLWQLPSPNEITRKFSEFRRKRKDNN